MTEEEAKALKAMRKEMEAKKKETLAAEYGNSSGGGGFGRGGARGGGRHCSKIRMCFPRQGHC